MSNLFIIGMSDDIDKWVQKRFKDGIERSSTRHPLMSNVRTKADEKIVKMFKGRYDVQSIFDHSQLKANSVDKLLFPIKIYYDKMKKIVKETTFFSELAARQQRIVDIVDDKFSQVKGNKKQIFKIPKFKFAKKAENAS